MAIKLQKEEVRYYLVFFLAFVRYLLPYYFNDNSMGILSNTPALDYSLLVISYLLMLLLIIDGGLRLTRTDLLLLAVYACLVLSTVLNHGELLTCLVNAVHVVMICLTIRSASGDEQKTRMMLRVIRDIALTIFIADIIMTRVFPSGVPSITLDPQYPYFLYGNVNTTVKYIFPGLCCSLLLDVKQGKKLSVFTAAFYAGFVFLCYSVYLMATGLCAMLFLLIWYAGMPLFIRKLRPVCVLLLLGIAVFELEIVVFRNQHLIDFLLSLFGKPTGFSSRDLLWSVAIRFIKENPLLGYGALDRETVLSMSWSPAGYHNYFLDSLFQRGIVGFIPLMYFLVAPLLRKAPEQHAAARYILIGAAFAYMMMFMFEPVYGVERFHIPVFYMLNILAEARNINFDREGRLSRLFRQPLKEQQNGFTQAEAKFHRRIREFGLEGIHCL